MEIEISLFVKLASIAVHAEELISDNGHIVDRSALQTLLSDKEVREMFDNEEYKPLLPLKR